LGMTAMPAPAPAALAGEVPRSVRSPSAAHLRRQLCLVDFRDDPSFRALCRTRATAMEVMKFGKGYVIANSTFSWWATWLNPNNYVDRVICCPNKWFGPEGPQDFETIYEPEWIRIETTSG
jgi:hypothetical protein